MQLWLLSEAKSFPSISPLRSTKKEDALWHSLDEDYSLPWKRRQELGWYVTSRKERETRQRLHVELDAAADKFLDLFLFWLTVVSMHFLGGHPSHQQAG